MSLVIDDSTRVQEAFCWFGAIPSNELEQWETSTGLDLPADLREFWRIAGGGDLFESETILRPNVPSAPGASFVLGDDTATINESHKAKGIPNHLFVFETGLFLSAVDLGTNEYVTLGQRRNYEVTGRFTSFDDWYLRTLRAEFGERYGLATRSPT